MKKISSYLFKTLGLCGTLLLANSVKMDDEQDISFLHEVREDQIKTSISKFFLTSEESEYSNIKIFAFDAQILGKQIASHLDVSLGRHITEKFNDGQISMRLLDSIRGKNVFLLKSFQNKNINEGVMELLLAVSCMKKQGAQTVTAIIPYFPYSQSSSQTVAVQGRDFYTCFASDLVKLLESSGCDTVITLNCLMANPKGFAQDSCFINIQATQLISPFIVKRGIQSPIFIGSRATPNHLRRIISLKNSCPLFCQDGQIGVFDQTSYLGANVEGRQVILFDNLIRTGKTMKDQVMQLRKMKAKDIYVFGFHGLCQNDQFQNLLTQLPIKELIMTNSIFHANQNKKVTNLSVSKLLAQVIALLSTQKSLSQCRADRQKLNYALLSKQINQVKLKKGKSELIT